jgi:hypothetical protein
VALIDQMVAWLECDSGKVRSASNIVGQVRPVRTDITRGHEQAPSPLVLEHRHTRTAGVAVAGRGVRRLCQPGTGALGLAVAGRPPQRHAGWKADKRRCLPVADAGRVSKPRLPVRPVVRVPRAVDRTARGLLYTANSSRQSPRLIA